MNASSSSAVRFLVIPLVLLALAGQPAEARELTSQQVDVGGHSLLFRVATPENPSPGQPVIVLESGGGLNSRYWSKLQPRMAEELGAVVVSYDRAGYGESELQDGAYDIGEEVDDLGRGLGALDIEGDLVLVGHSYGGLLVQLFAARNAERVCGLVFMDPNIPIGYHTPYRQWIEGQELPPELSDPKTTFDKANAKVTEGIDRSMSTVFREGYLKPELPVVVLSAEKGLFGNERLNEAFILAHRLLAKASVRGEWKLVEGVGHGFLPGGADQIVESVTKVVGLCR